jgi:tetratricopeptide (TPR) repeat protein
LKKTFFRLGLLVMTGALLAPGSLRAADDESTTKEEPQSLSDAVGDGLSKMDPLLKAKDWVGVTNLIDGLLKDAKPDSYDAAVLYRTLAQVDLQKQDYIGAIEPLEKSLAISNRHHFFNRKETCDLLYIMSEMYYNRADTAKGDHELAVASFDKAIDYIQQWFALTDRPTEDISMYYAQLLYGAAVNRNPQHPDPELIQKARQQVEKTLLMSVHPKDSMYQFLLATLQQELDYATAADVMELLLSHNPNNKAYWQALYGDYMMLAQDPKNKDAHKTRDLNIRAINTIERAQALGYLNTPHDNYTLFTLYYNLGQYSLAADILHKGLTSGGIDNDINNWLLLSACYQQTNDDFKSIDALKEAAQHFPSNGELESKIAQAYLGLDNNEEALKHGMAAIEKGHLSKPEQTYVFVAYIAYELQRYDEAKEAIEHALSLMKKPDHQAIGLKNAIEEAIKERDERKAEKDADKKKADEARAEAEKL